MVGGGRTGNRGESSVGKSMRYRRRVLSLVAPSGQMKRAVQKHEALAKDWCSEAELGLPCRICFFEPGGGA
jgi:hypothetical protein